jgi:transposase
MKEVEKMRNSKYTKEFRDETVQLILSSDKSAMQIAKDLGINDKTIYNWIKIYKNENNINTPINETKNQKKSSQDELLAELKQLRTENKILKQERDILKKATAYFAKETL